jgi:hypothetical protein
MDLAAGRRLCLSCQSLSLSPLPPVPSQFCGLAESRRWMAGLQIDLVSDRLQSSCELQDAVAAGGGDERRCAGLSAVLRSARI